MNASAVIACMVSAAAAASAAGLLLPDKDAVKWTNILCALYILTCLLMSFKSFSLSFGNEAEEIIHSSEKISADITERIDSAVKDIEDVSP